VGNFFKKKKKGKELVKANLQNQIQCFCCEGTWEAWWFLQVRFAFQNTLNGKLALETGIIGNQGKK